MLAVCVWLRDPVDVFVNVWDSVMVPLLVAVAEGVLDCDSDCDCVADIDWEGEELPLGVDDWLADCDCVSVPVPDLVWDWLRVTLWLGVVVALPEPVALGDAVPLGVPL